MIRVEALNAGYGDVQILWDLNLAVEPGSITALIGANGVGKTTFLRTLAGAIRPYSGRILYDGKEVTAQPQTWRARHGIMLVPEGRQLYAGLSVEDNLMMGAYTRRDRPGVRRDLEWVYTILPVLKERRRQLAGTLSGGEQQMCAVARGLMAAPRLLLLDELSLGPGPRGRRHPHPRHPRHPRRAGPHHPAGRPGRAAPPSSWPAAGTCSCTAGWSCPGRQRELLRQSPDPESLPGHLKNHYHTCKEETDLQENPGNPARFRRPGRSACCRWRAGQKDSRRRRSVIKIGASVSLTGNLARFGNLVRTATSCGRTRSTRKGGIEVGGQKMPVEIVYYDDQSDNQTAAKLTEKLITEDKVQFLLGPYGSGPDLRHHGHRREVQPHHHGQPGQRHQHLRARLPERVLRAGPGHVDLLQLHRHAGRPRPEADQGGHHLPQRQLPGQRGQGRQSTPRARASRWSTSRSTPRGSRTCPRRS